MRLTFILPALLHFEVAADYIDAGTAVLADSAGSTLE